MHSFQTQPMSMKELQVGPAYINVFFGMTYYELRIEITNLLRSLQFIFVNKVVYSKSSYLKALLLIEIYRTTKANASVAPISCHIKHFMQSGYTTEHQTR